MKRSISLFLLLCLVLGLCACSSVKEEANADPAITAQPVPHAGGNTLEEETDLVVKTQQLEPLGAAICITGMSRIDDTILLAGFGKEKPMLALTAFWLNENGSLTLDPPRELPLEDPEAADQAWIYSICAGGDGCFYVLTGELPEQTYINGALLSNPDWANNYRILRYTREGDLAGSLSLPDFSLQNLMYIDALDKDRLFLLGVEGLCIVDWGGAVHSFAPLPDGSFPTSAQRCGEKEIVCVFPNDGHPNDAYYFYSFDGGELEPLPLSDPQHINWSRVQGLEDEILIQDAQRFFLADMDADEVRELMSWSFSDGMCITALRLGEGAFLCQQENSSLLSFAWLAPRTSGERSSVRVALYRSSDWSPSMDEAESALRGYENQSEAYHYEITSFDAGELDKLLVSFTASDPPDLVIFDGGVNTASAYFEDLFPWLDADPELSRESFLPRLLEDLSVSGELHELWTGVNVSTIAARASDVGDGRGLTTADYDRILAENEQYQALFQSFMSKENLLSFVARVGISRYVNKVNGTCNFEDPDFRELLAWCAEMCDTVPEGNSDAPVLGPEDVVLWYEWMQTPDRVHLIESNVFQEPYVFVGFPTGDDMGSYYTLEGVCMAIPRQAVNKDGAWAYLRSRLLPAAQRELRFPIHLDTCLSVAGVNLSADEINQLLDLLEHTGFAENVADEPLRQMVLECGLTYLHGEKTLDEALSTLQGRASIYMSERYG